MPAGFQAGDLLIGIAGTGRGLTPTAIPSGSTTVQDVVDAAVYDMNIVRKVAAGGDVFTWTSSSSVSWSGCVVAITAGTFDTTTPVQGNVGVAQGTTSTLFTTPASTPGNTDSLIISVFGAQLAVTWTTADSSPAMTELADLTSTGTAAASLSVYRSNTPPAASSLTRTGTASATSANGAAFMLFVNPSALAPLPIWNQRSPQQSEQFNAAGPYSQPANWSQIF
jgi:hypothetical protein